MGITSTFGMKQDSAVLRGSQTFVAPGEGGIFGADLPAYEVRGEFETEAAGAILCRTAYLAVNTIVFITINLK